MNNQNNLRTGLEVAIIGMAGRFPGAQDIRQFWENLKNGRESIAFFSDEELQENNIEPEKLQNPDFVRAKGILADIEYFDALFFDYTPAEAELVNPPLRILLECCWEALEDAGYDPDSFDGAIGLYAGASSTFHWEGLTLLSGKSNSLGGLSANFLTNKDFLTTTISYKLNLKGPSSMVQTACSTSLVAIHWACRAVLSGECHMALAGGVGVDLPRKNGYIYQEGMIQSPDGSCRAFDARAKGTIGGEGAGIVVLKRLKIALADRDNIYAVIKGSAINNDGRRKVGYTAPSVNGQVEVIRTALAMARTGPESIGYIETHGTGTPLGDPIEIDALKMVFNSTGTGNGTCPIGAVKTNIGHLDAAAGAAGFIKTVLALKHRLIPPTLHYETPNPEIDFENSPFYVNNRLLEWKNNGNPLRAGVSSFGIGGTNAHVVLEQAPPAEEEESPGSPPAAPAREFQLLLLSAKTQSALDRATQNLADHFKLYPQLNLADAAYTLQQGRKRFQFRRMSVCSSLDNAAAVLSSLDSRRVYTASSKLDNRPVIFMFSGLGSQYVNMGLGLYEQEPVFREEMDRCFEILKPLTGYDLKEILYPALASNPGTAAGLPGNDRIDINRFDVAQLVIFIFAYTLAKLLISWGIKPRAMIGYSFGEYAAACIAGVFSLEHALKLVVSRGQLINKIPAGAMTSVPLTREEVEPLLNEHLSIAIDNGFSCIVAGAPRHIDEFEKQIKEKKLLGIRVPASHALHSKMMEPILKELAEELSRFQFNEPQIPYVSNVTGHWITTQDASNPGYWTRHMRETVQFASGMKLLLKEENALFIEIGPGQDLKALAMRYLENSPEHPVINLVKHPQRTASDVSFLLNKIGLMWLYGVKIDWHGFSAREKRRRMPLPTYPFDRRWYWFDLKAVQDGSMMSIQPPPAPGMADWIYFPTWRPSSPKRLKDHLSPGKQKWLVFMNCVNMVELLLDQLEEKSSGVIGVEMTQEYCRSGDNRYGIDPQNGQHYEALFNELQTRGDIPDRILHLWGIDGNDTSRENEQITRNRSFTEAQYRGFYSLLYLAKALGRLKSGKDIFITVLTDNVQEVTGGERLCPEKSTVLGLLKSIPQEYPGLRCSAIDIALPEPGSAEETRLVRALLEDLTAHAPEPVLAYRNFQRWEQIFAPLHLEEATENELRFREPGVYLITGGLGNIGLMFAQLLVQRAGAGTRLILTGRSQFPGLHEWQHWLDTHDEDHPVSIKIKHLQKLEETGARVLYYQADVADYQQMRSILAQAEETCGPINGIIHAAGMFERGSLRTIQEISVPDCEAQFQAKGYGTLNIEELFKDKHLDFCWVLSSISCVLGGLGFGAYASANYFMDVLVKKHNQLHPLDTPWFSLNWDGMEPEKSISLFERMFTLENADQLVVSNGGNLQERIDKWIKLETFKNKEETKAVNQAAFHPRPDLSSAYVPPNNPCQQALVEIWQNLLGFDEIGIQDDFLELGGDSLRSITMISRIHRELNVNVPISFFFADPTIEALDKYISAAGETSQYTGVEPAEEKEFYPVSAAQEGLYLLQQMNEDSISYNMTYIMAVKVALDKHRLEEAVRKLVKRHESLRTSFRKIDNQPVQRIHKNLDFSFEFFNPGSGQGVEGIIRHFVRPFDLATAPLLRMGLIDLAQAATDLNGESSQAGKEPQHILLVDMHHIISDGISLQITMGDFMQLYEANDLEPLPLQYKDFSQWQRGEKTRTTIQKQEQYWLKEFSGEIPVLELPYDFTRPALRSFAGDIIDFEIDERKTTRLKELALQEDVTMFVVLLAVYNVLLFKLSGQEDIIVGTGMAGRGSEELYRIIGLFINTLPLRNHPARSKSFKTFLKEVKETTLLAYENQDYHYNDLVKKVVPNRVSHRNPLYDAVIVLQNVETAVSGDSGPDPGLTGPGMEMFNHTNKISKYDLSLICTHSGNRLTFMLEYCASLFKKETVQRFSDYFKEIISQILADDEIKLEDITVSHRLLTAKSEEYEDQMVVDL